MATKKKKATKTKKPRRTRSKKVQPEQPEGIVIPTLVDKEGAKAVLKMYDSVPEPYRENLEELCKAIADTLRVALIIAWQAGVHSHHHMLMSDLLEDMDPEGHA